MNKNHEATFMGTIKKKRYKFDLTYENGTYGYGYTPCYNPKIIKEYLEEEYDVIQSNTFKNPQMNINDLVYLDSINKDVMVTKVVRDSEGDYIYYTDYIIKEIEDEDTIRTFIKAKEDEMEIKIEELKRKEKYANNMLKRNIAEVEIPSNKWYQFWK